MGKIAFVFSGQGAQAPGMGQTLYNENTAARTMMDALEALRPGTLEMCFRATAEQLAETKNTQPAMVAMELGACAALQAAGVAADATAGFSLGELTALACAGALAEKDAFLLAAVRGEIMQRAAEQVDGAMAAVVKLTREQVEEIARRFERVYPVNYNCPGQIAVSGLREELSDFSTAVKAAGGRALPLKVRSCFHSPYMEAASAEFARLLADVQFTAPRLPLYADLTGGIYPADLRGTLASQMAHPVLWQTIIENMIATGVDCFVEIGPGKTLTGFIQRTSAQVKTFHVEDTASLNEAVEGIKAC